MESRLEVKELIRYTISAFFSKKKYPLSNTSLLKILYKIKKYAIDTPLEQFLQFYWFEHGPYSPLLLEIKDEMRSEGIIQEIDKGLVTEKSRIIQHDEFFQNIRTHINQIINESYSDSSFSLIDDIYSTDAPYRFYVSFKNRFSATLDSFYKDPNTHIKPDQLITILQETIGDLPNEPLFSNFKYNYLDFVELVSAIVEAKKITEFGDRLQNDSSEIFKTFARGVRILHHDPYYESEVENWKQIFNKAVFSMETNIIDLYCEANETPIKNIHVSTLEEIIQEVLSLKAKKKLASVSFLPSIMDESINYGSLDASIFNRLSDPDFKGLLQRFQTAKKAIIDKVDDGNLNAIKYRIIAS